MQNSEKNSANSVENQSQFAELQNGPRHETDRMARISMDATFATGESRQEANVAVNTHNFADDFYEGGEIVEGRTADVVCREAKPMRILGGMTYEEVMQFTPAAEPAETRFEKLSEDDFPIFSKQQILRGGKDHPRAEGLSLPSILREYVKDTARLVDVIKDYDMVIYLDKSARPVSWFVNEFWEEFTDQKRPAEANLAIDRMFWFPRAGVNVDPLGNLAADRDKKATIVDYLGGKNKIDKSTYAEIRSLFIPGGVETEDADEIMNIPTGLDGKRVIIIDEVRNSGATLDIAKDLIGEAIPELGKIDGEIFWHLPDLYSEVNPNSDPQMNQAPIWYDQAKNTNWTGRGVWDINTGYFLRQYNANPNPYTRAQKLGSIVLGEPMNLEEEPGQLSKRIQSEVRRIHAEYRKGHVLPAIPAMSSEQVVDKILDFCESIGITFRANASTDYLKLTSKYEIKA